MSFRSLQFPRQFVVLGNSGKSLHRVENYTICFCIKVEFESTKLKLHVIASRFAEFSELQKDFEAAADDFAVTRNYCNNIRTENVFETIVMQCNLRD
jgi:hypothetical protein